MEDDMLPKASKLPEMTEEVFRMTADECDHHERAQWFSLGPYGAKVGLMVYVLTTKRRRLTQRRGTTYVALPCSPSVDTLRCLLFADSKTLCSDSNSFY